MRSDADRQTAGTTPTLRRLTQPWTLILIITGVFQVFRGAPIDGAFFLGIAAVLLADALGWIRLRGIARPRAAWLLLAAIPLAVALVLAPRHGVVEGVIVAGIGVSALLIGWSPQQRADTAPAPHNPGALPPEVLRTAILWSIIGVICALWEVASFLLGLTSSAAALRHPSISELFDPVLHSVLGRSVFTVVWLLVGVALLRSARKRAAR